MRYGARSRGRSSQTTWLFEPAERPHDTADYNRLQFLFLVHVQVTFLQLSGPGYALWANSGEGSTQWAFLANLAAKKCRLIPLSHSWAKRVSNPGSAPSTTLCRCATPARLNWIINWIMHLFGVFIWGAYPREYRKMVFGFYSVMRVIRLSAICDLE